MSKLPMLPSKEPGHVPAWEYVKSVIDAAGVLIL